MSEPQWSALLDEIDALVMRMGTRGEILQAISELLHARVAHYDWVGFYLVDESKNNLVLGPFAGEPTEHVRIAFGQGICGQAAERKETFVVADVMRESNYLSCSPRVQSEIVVPILSQGEVVAELDIDSHTPAAFTAQDRAFLERVAAVLAPIVESQP